MDQDQITRFRNFARSVAVARHAQAKEAIASGNREITRLESEIEKILNRIMSASNDAIVQRYEQKVEIMERQKLLMAETVSKHAAPASTFEEKLEPALRFLSNPYKLWQNGTVEARRLVLKLAFATPIVCCPNGGARTASFSFPFKALRDVSEREFCNGAPHRRNFERFDRDF